MNQDIKHIVFDTHNGIGDFFASLKALYAIKQLYPKTKISVLLPSTKWEGQLDINFDFIDEIIIFDSTYNFVLDENADFYKKLALIECNIFISTRKQIKFYKTLAKKVSKLKIKKYFLAFTTKSFLKHLFSNKIFFSSPFQKKLHFSEYGLNLVRKIDKKHYDKNIKNIDFSCIKHHILTKKDLVDRFFESIDIKYKKIVGINAFSHYCEASGINFFLRDWIKLAEELAKTYPDILFVLLNYKANPVQFSIDESKNIRVYVNDEDLGSLVEISRRLDYLISIDTGNVHLCDVLQIPTFAFIRKETVYKFCGGSFGAEFDSIVVDYGWQKNYRRIFNNFLQKAKEKIAKIN